LDHPVRLEIQGYIATVTIDRPPVNAVDRSALAAIRDTFRSLEDRQDVRAAVFTGAGTRAFIGGADLTSVDNAPVGLGQAASDVIDRGRVARDAMWAVLDCPVPVVGAINGPAIGAGLAFAACCDILLASETATFGTLEINVGLLGASAHLSTMVGRHKAREMFLLGEKVSAAELHRLGAIRAVVPLTQLMQAALEVAHQLAEKSPVAMRLAKQSMNRVEGLRLKEAYQTEQDYTNRLMGFQDSMEARQAYLEKRDPDWKWR
jgi:enoyl-CoA hydratase